MKLTLSTSSIRAEIRSAIALKCSLGSIHALPLTTDRDAALNRQIAFHFTTLLVHLAPAVEDYNITPSDYCEITAAEEVMLEVGLRDGCFSADARIVRTMIEDYISARVLACLLADIAPRQSEMHELSARLTLERLSEAARHPADDLGRLRIARTI